MVTSIVEKLNKYFPGAELPLAFYYTDDPTEAEPAPIPNCHRCFVCSLAPVRQGRSQRFDVGAVMCLGGQRSLGFTRAYRPHYEHFLSSGIPGELQGERFRKTPEMVAELRKRQPLFDAPGKYLVCKRLDSLRAEDTPLAVVVFPTPDILAGLVTLASYDDPRADAVITPIGTGCATIVQHPFHEARSDSPRAVVGGFDISSRGCVPPDRLIFAVPWSRFLTMVGNMDESFLIRPSWTNVRERIAKYGE